MKRIPSKIHDKFNKDVCTEESSDFLKEVLDKHWSHEKWEDGSKSIYNITKKMSKFLLHSLKHELPITRNDIEDMYNFSKVLESTGIKGDFPKYPIIIDTNSKTVVLGSDRLLALALSDAYGTYFEIKVI